MGKIKEEYEKLINFFVNNYEENPKFEELRNDATIKHPDCLPLTGDESAVLV